MQKLQMTTPKPPTKENDVTKNDINKLKDELKRETDELKVSIKNLSKEFNQLKDESYKFNEINERSSDSLMEKVKRQLGESEHLLAKYENKLSEMNNKIPSIPVPNYKEQKEMQNNVLQALELQKNKVDQMLSNINDVSHKIDNVPEKITRNITKNSDNKNLQIIDDFKRELTNGTEKTLNLIEDKLRQIQNANVENHNELKKSIGDIKTNELILQKSLETDFSSINKEIKDLSRFEEVLLQSANGVLDTKRRVEYGVHQVILEMEELLKTHIKELNTSISER